MIYLTSSRTDSLLCKDLKKINNELCATAFNACYKHELNLNTFVLIPIYYILSPHYAQEKLSSEKMSANFC